MNSYGMMEDEWTRQNSEGRRLTELDVLKGCSEGTTPHGGTLPCTPQHSLKTPPLEHN